jgi:SAM-dependent methyltransferase
MPPLVRKAFAALPDPVRASVIARVKPLVERRRSTAWMRDLTLKTVVFENVREAMAPAPGAVDDLPLVQRVVAAYRLAAAEDLKTGASMWTDFFKTMHGAIHRTFLEGSLEDAAAVLRDPSRNNLFYGFDSLSAEIFKHAASAAWRQRNAEVAVDGLARLAIAIGAIRSPYPAAYSTGYGERPRLDAESLFRAIDGEAGRAFTLPNPYPHEPGAATSRGILSYRAPQAMYQALRIRDLTKGLARPRVLEIGGGLGRTAFHAAELGIDDYTIVDIPISSAAQGYFLGRALGPDRISLLGESHADAAARVKLASPDALFADGKRYDIVVNVDSLTEMAQPVAERYIGRIKANGGVFLSINHEFNPFTVKELFGEACPGAPLDRRLYPMRDGYLEETALLD